MVTWPDLFQFVIMLCGVISLVVLLTKRKKRRPRSGWADVTLLMHSRRRLAFTQLFGSLVESIITITV